MLRRTVYVSLALALISSACSPSGELRNPFEKPKPFVATTVPADFAIVVDENHDTFYARQHIQQVITAADAMSRTTYTYYRDLNDTVGRRFSQESPLSASQLQAMWNEVCKNELMIGARPWINWRSDSDMYRRNTYTIQIRANGAEHSYRQVNGFSGTVRPVMLLVEAVRLPISQDAGTSVVMPEGTRIVVPAAATESAATAPAASTQPATEPATAPATAP